MKCLLTKKSKAIVRRYCAGSLALLLSVAFALPGWAECSCCASMDLQPMSIDEVSADTAPSCHNNMTISDEATEEIASATEEIASATEEIAAPCTMDCMQNEQSPATAAPGIVESHNAPTKVHPTLSLSDLVYSTSPESHYTSTPSREAPSYSAIHQSTSSVPLRI